MDLFKIGEAFSAIQT